MKLKLRANSSLLLKFFVAFLSLLVVPVVIISIVMNANVRNFFVDVTRKNMQNSVTSLMDTAEKALYDAEQAAMSATYNERLKKIAMMDIDISNLDAEGVYLVSDVFDSLADIASGNRNIHSIYVYNKEKNYVVSSEKRYDLPQDGRHVLWFKRYRENPEMVSWFESFAFSDSGAQIPVISALYPIATYSGIFEGAIVINIPLERLQSGTDEDSHVFIIPPDQSGSITIHELMNVSEGERESLNETVSASVERHGSFYVDVGGKKCIAAYAKSMYNNWNYLSVRPVEQAFAEIDGFTQLIVILSLGMLAVGCAVAYFLSKSFYSPVKKIISDIKTRSKGPDSTENEWKYIENALNEMEKQEQKIEELMQAERRNAKTILLKQIIADGIDRWDEYYELFPQPYFSVALIEIDHKESFDKKYTSGERSYFMNVILKVAKNIVNSQLGFTADGYMQEHVIVLIINSETSNLNEHGKMLSLLHQEVQKIIGMSVTTAVGQTVEAGEVSRSYESAKQARDMRFFAGDGQLILYAGDTGGYGPEVLFEAELLFSCLQSGRREQLYKLVNSMVRTLSDPQNQNIEYAMQQLMMLFMSIVRYMNEHSIPRQAVMHNGQSPYGEFLQCDTIDKIENYLCDLCDKIIDCQTLSEENGNYMAKVLAYVRENYHKDIDVYTMASDLKISYSQLRRMFIEYTGENIMAYTNRLRIEEAKELLTTTEDTVMEIALQLGYNNDQSFNRYFKKLVGITPGEYRKLHAR